MVGSVYNNIRRLLGYWKILKFPQLLFIDSLFGPTAIGKIEKKERWNCWCLHYKICRLMGLQKLCCLLCLIENSYLNVILSFDCAATNRDLNVIPSLVFTDFSGFCEWNVGLLMGCYSSKPEKKNSWVWGPYCSCCRNTL